MTHILFRCDASLLIGSGHVIRCRTLARELQRRGAEVSFLCRRQPGDLISLLQKEFEVLALPEQPLSSCVGLQSRDLYGAWLGCSQDTDAFQCLEVLAQAGITCVSWLVADHYGLDTRWEAQLMAGLSGANISPKVLVIDDLADRPHEADLLLDQNFFGEATNQRYQKLVPQHCRQLLGPHYALLGPEYAQLHPLLPARKELRRVLVFFGGVDPANLTGRALEALLDPALADLAVDVVLGRQSHYNQVVDELVARRPLTKQHLPLPSLVGLIARADLAIGACGATTWERACLGLPSLVVATSANQLSFAQALDQAGHLRLLGDEVSVTVEQIRSELLALIAEPLTNKAGSGLTDGWGNARVAMAMLGEQGAISLRPATERDEALLLRWANDRQARADSFSPKLIAPTDHHHWFQKGLADSNRLLMIALTMDGCPIGQIQFDRQPDTDEGRAGEALVALSLDHCSHGHGLASELVRLGLQAMEQHWGLATDSVVEDLPSNTASNACFALAGNNQELDLLSISAPPIYEYSSQALAVGRITLLSDDSSWLNAFLPGLILALWQRGHAVRWIHDPAQLSTGDVCLLLSCSRLITAERLALHRHNLVVHESALPKGKGWSPMSWQILESAENIPVTLFEAIPQLDAGDIYLQKTIKLNGNELSEDWRNIQGNTTIQMLLHWFDNYASLIVNSRSQSGMASNYSKRTPRDSELDVTKSISEQFSLLRIVDNKSYPAHFFLNNCKYTLLIRKS
ncbi:UDP-2,4-diacetamido-2,4,6-trideoxy-beta-L-altropyranose hydrolase [bacterium]|nr:UDP-2,4-diacetamido-2,4,6-trideoxy-beta-L-altropyranose hydrolase [bacterium]